MSDKAYVCAQGLRREFGETLAVRDISFDVPEGAVLALVGPNGAGKSTLLRMLAALMEPPRGTALVGGVDVRRHPRGVHALLGFLPDFFGLYESLTVEEYLQYFARAYGLGEFQRMTRVRESMEAVRLSDRRAQKVGELSRGMRQRLGIARTLVHDPPLLLLDEPASGLDPEARHELQGLFRGLAAKGKTLIVSSHILAELEDYCTHVAMLSRGELVAFGPVNEVRRSSGRGRLVILRVRGEIEKAGEILGRRDDVTDWKIAKDEGRFLFSGDDAGLAQILKELVGAGVPVIHFGEEKGGIQDAYLALMGGEG